MSPWSLSLDELQAVTPWSTAPRINPEGANPRVVDSVLETLRTRGVMPSSGVNASNEEASLRRIRIELFVSFYVPRDTIETFTLSVHWMALLWMIDDSLDKTQSARSLQKAVDMTRREIIPIFETLTISKSAPPVGHCVLDFCKRLQERSASPAAFAHFQRTTAKWLQSGTLKLARHKLLGTHPSIEEHITTRRWDGAADSCIACLEYSFPTLPDSVIEDTEVEQLRAVACAHIGLLNDLISYEQEVSSVQRRGGYQANANLIATIQHQNQCSTEDASRYLLNKLRNLKTQHEALQASLRHKFSVLPSTERAATFSYLESIGRFMGATLIWSLLSGRYRSKTSPLLFLRQAMENDFSSVHSFY